LKLTRTNRFGKFITDKDMTAATQACKDGKKKKIFCLVCFNLPQVTRDAIFSAYKAWCQATGILYKDPEKYAAEKSHAAVITSAQR
jgi:hypothetical protein